MEDIVKVGDLFRCRRRGHVVQIFLLFQKVNPFSTDTRVYADYLNARGRRVSIPLLRLMDKSRFDRVVTSPGALPVAQSIAA